ncbi:MAG: carbonic anhydrase family protein [Sulfuritalea sp.]|nr:carbonic anhydrase family protein [Sulfuritalea sp.]
MSVFRMPQVIATTVAAAAFILMANLPARAASWQAVIVGQNETIEIDKERIARGAGGTTGWSRIILGRSVNDPGGVYNEIHAQNLYDCAGRRFTTLRRAYFNGDTLVREESVSRQRANKIQIGSIDERLLNEACGAHAGVEEPGFAESVGRALQGLLDPERPTAMHADMRTPADGTKGRIAPVADTTIKPVAAAATAASAAPATVAPTPSGEKPRHILLPPIDKAAADQAAAGAGLKAPAPAAATGAAPTPGAKPEIKSVAAAASQAAAAQPETASEKRLRELQYATSGPRKTVARKKPAPAAPAPQAENPAAHMHVHWAYEGAGAPANWGKLRNEYATCGTGQRQSPIDIREGIKVNLETIRFDYKPTQFRIVDNGHTLQVTVGEGMAMHVMGKRYELIQFHFHRPAEERVNGKLYDMVVHLVHKNDEGQLAVIAVLLEKGAEHPLIQTLWNNMPLEREMEVTPAEPIDLMKLLPEIRSYWTYMGSLTTPPCTEGVLWMVMKQPLQVSPDQIAIFSRLYRNNARPVQPANGRLIKESR